jgi:hypothetical protein
MKVYLSSTYLDLHPHLTREFHHLISRHILLHHGYLVLSFAKGERKGLSMFMKRQLYSWRSDGHWSRSPVMSSDRGLGAPI